MAVKTAGKSIKQLVEERAALVVQAQAYHKANEENWSAENDTEFNEMMADASALKSATDRLQNLAQLEASVANNTSFSTGFSFDTGNRAPSKISIRDGRNANGSPRYVEIESGDRGTAKYHKEFCNYLALRDFESPQRRANLQSDSATQAGYLLASEEFASGILKEVDDLLFIRRRAKVHTVREASSLGIRRRTARLNSWAWGGELNVASNDTTLAYGKKILTPHHMTGSIKVSRDLIRRSAGTVESEVRYEMARNAAELQEDAFLLGTGVQRPLGVFVASSDGISTSRDVNTGSTTNFTADGLLAAKYALKSQYRSGARGSISWLFHRNGIERIAKLKDQENQYLLRVGMGVAQDGGAPEDTLLGYPVDESERAPNTFTDGNYVGLLANWNYYEIVDALDMEMQVLFELNARTSEVEYIGRMKCDGMPTLEEAFVRVKCAS